MRSPILQAQHLRYAYSTLPRNRRLFNSTTVLILGGTATLLLWLCISWRVNLSPSFSSSMLIRAMRASSPSSRFTILDKHQQQRPWVGAQALVPPPIEDGKDSTTPGQHPHYHVRVIIRVHHQHKHLVQGLVQNLRHQQRLHTSPSSSSPSSSSSVPTPRLSMDFALVPTELSGVNVTQAIAQGFWQDPNDPFPHVYAVDLNEAFYLTAAERAASFRCSTEQLKSIARVHGEESVKKICLYNNHAFYQATDVAVREMVEGCDWCTHVLVTNDDNGYHPAFFEQMLLQSTRKVGPLFFKSKRRKMQLAAASAAAAAAAIITTTDGAGQRTSSKLVEWEKTRKERAGRTTLEDGKGKGWDVVVCDFTTSGFLVEAGWELGKLDLGGVLLSKEIVAKVGGFVAALPPGAGAIEAHNGDWHFVSKALSVGGLATVVEKLLFFHN